MVLDSSLQAETKLMELNVDRGRSAGHNELRKKIYVSLYVVGFRIP